MLAGWVTDLALMEEYPMSNRLACRVSGVALAAAFALSLHGHGPAAPSTDDHANLSATRGHDQAPGPVKAGFVPNLQHGTGH